MKPFISLCMIVKNEEKVLQRCLDSVKDAVDEIIIVDTGSTDQTKEIALNYVNKVYEFEWTNSFADARNFANSKSSGEWLLIMDADEYVDTINLQETIDSIKNLNEDIDAFEVKIYNFTGKFGERIVQHKSIRLFKNDPSIYFFRAIHEQVVKKDGELNVGGSDLVLYHSGYLNGVVKEKDKNDRNKKLLEKEIEKSGNSGFDYFNFGNEYLSQGKTQEALEAYLNAYKKKPDFRYSWVSFSLIQIINCLIELKRYQDALNVIFDSENIYSQSPDFKCLKASIYSLQKRYDDAVDELEELINNKEEYRQCITSIDFLEYHPHRMLGEIYKNKKNNEKAVYHFAKALSANRYCYQSLYHILEILSKNCTMDEIDTFINSLWISNNKRDLYNIINLLLLFSEIELAEQYINKIEDDLIKNGYTIKLEIIKGNWTPLSDFIKANSVENLNILIQEGCIDIYDLILFSYLKDKSFVDILKISVDNKDFHELLEFLFSVESNLAPSKEMYLNLITRSIQLKQTTMMEHLLEKIKTFESFNLPIGKLLYQKGLRDEAHKFYEKIDLTLYDDDIFMNLIEICLDNNDSLQAWQWILYAFSLDKTDYRYFEHVFELILENEAIRCYDTREILNAAFKLYPGSAKLIHLNSLLQNQLITNDNEITGERYTVGFFVETTFHYYVYESIINELIQKGVTCHLVINDNYGTDSETSFMYEDLLNFIQHLDRNDIEAYTVSMIKENEYKYDCMVSPYYSGCLNDLAFKQVRAMYGLLVKDYWNYSWWNVFYDKILCYSEYDYSRLNIFNNCSIVGTPKFDSWFRKEIPNLNQVERKFNLDKNKSTILYAPTYGNLSSIDDWIEEINNLQRDYNIIIKLHHGTAFRESENYRRQYIYNNFSKITCDSSDLFALFAIADFVLTDSSSMIFESMLTDQNILLLNPEFRLPVEKNSGEELLRENIININKGSNIREYLGDSGLFERQKEVVKDVLNKVYKLTDGNSGKRAADEIVKLLVEEGAEQNKFLLSIRSHIFG